MNKTIIEIAVLAFCVCIVIFGLQGYSLMEVVSRSFLVFVGVVILSILCLVAVLLIADRVHEKNENRKDVPPQTRKEYPLADKGPRAVPR